MKCLGIFNLGMFMRKWLIINCTHVNVSKLQWSSSVFRNSSGECQCGNGLDSVVHCDRGYLHTAQGLQHDCAKESMTLKC